MNDRPGDITSDRNPAMPPAPAAQTGGPSYYDVSILKSPVWKWHVAWYFFFGGVSAGSYVLGRLAERAGGGRGGRYADLARWGTTLGWLSLLPCPPLLIADLGDPKRFHHMLRVWKPSSPMNLGTWTVTGYAGAATAAVLREWLAEPGRTPQDRSTASKLFNGTTLLVSDAAGVPLALLVAAYPGVLLSCTSNPLWCKNPWLSALFSAAAVGSGAAATSLALDVTSRRESPAQGVLDKVHTAAHAAEAVTLAGYLRHAGEKAAPLTRGRMKPFFRLALGGMIGGELLKWLPAPRPLRRACRILSSLVSLGGELSLKWAIVHGGHEAAQDPHTARLVSTPDAPKLPLTTLEKRRD